MNSDEKKMDGPLRNSDAESTKTYAVMNRQSWANRLVSHSALVATSRQGASMQQVMDDLRD
jgi:hypothetical protein